jgi:hypothetical protein
MVYVFSHSERVYSDTALSSSAAERRRAHVLGRTAPHAAGAGVSTEGFPARAALLRGLGNNRRGLL